VFTSTATEHALAGQNILIIEDNLDTTRNIRMYLEHHGFTCQAAHLGAAGLAMEKQERFSLVILDVMLPDMSGFEVCRQIRDRSDMPIIMLTARVESQDLIHGLECGADEYVRKPFSNKELVARVKAHLRRAPTTASPRSAGPFEIWSERQQILVDQQDLGLTRTEFNLLEALLKAPEKVFSRERLCQLGGDDLQNGIDRAVDVHIHNIRKKAVAAGLETHGIVSVYGLGYKWVMP
jgi:DNA-binding response OmpR family regulator